jgi:CRISPR/Cas system-associated protein Csm6
MSRTFICSVGTSLLDNAKDRLGGLTRLEGLSADAIEAEPAKKILNQIKKDLIEKADTDDKRRKLAAELKGLLLYRPEITPADEIFLLHDDSLSGRVCAEGLKLALTAFLSYPENSPNIIVQKVDGLQVQRFRDFNRTGIRRLYEVVLKIINDRGGKYNPNIILNITGGYKAVVPYLTLLGMLFRTEIIYIFMDDKSELIRLPVLPLTYREDLFWRAAPFLQRLRADTVVPAHEFPKELEEYRSSYIPAIIEEDQGELILSAFGELLYDRFLQDYPTELPTTNIRPEDKQFKMPSDAHHDNDYIEPIVRRMLQSPYVEAFLRGENGNSNEKKGISQIGENGEITFNVGNKLGSRFTIKTTGGDNQEMTRRIAEHLIKKGYLN